MAKVPSINKGPKKENRSEAPRTRPGGPGNFPYYTDNESSGKITPPGKKKAPSKMPDRQKQAQAWMRGKAR